MSGRFRSSGISGRRNIENPGAKTEVYYGAREKLDHFWG